jgi:hypothetical protein
MLKSIDHLVSNMFDFDPSFNIDFGKLATELWLQDFSQKILHGARSTQRELILVDKSLLLYANFSQS